MKMLVSLVLVGLIAMASADCDALARLKLKQQWADAFGDGNDRMSFGTAIFKALFAQAPASRDLFKRVHGDDVHSPEFRAHMMRVLNGLDMCVSLLDDADTLASQLSHLNQQHKERHIPANYFTLLGNAIMEVVPAKLGRCFDADAWSSCYEVIAHGITA